jgi:Uma2 family endonuclease
MTLTPTIQHATPDAYLAYDLAHEGKHEYWDGEIVAMAGAMDTHNSIQAYLTLAIGPEIVAQKCRPYGSDQRVKIPSGNYVYPDFSFACDPEFTDERPNSLLNPHLVVEVSSPSTALHDRTRKLDAYLSIPSLRAYWILESDAVQATLYERSGDGWTYRTVRGREGEIRSDLFDGPVALSAVYLDLDLPDPPPVGA